MHTNSIDNPNRGDAHVYIRYAYNLGKNVTFSMERSENPKPDSYKSPGYPFLLALAMFLTKGDRFYPLILTIQAILGAMVPPLTYIIGRSFLTAPLALLAAFLTLICPHLLAIGNLLLTETLFSFLQITGLVLFTRAWKTESPLLFLTGGSFFGLGYLTNQTFFFVPFLLIPVVFFLAKPGAEGQCHS